MVMYQCWETAQYFDKNTNKRIPAYEAFDKAKSSQVDFSKNPPVEYKFSDDILVKPRHFQNVKILWRPQEKIDEALSEMDFEGDSEALGSLPRDLVYPDESEIGPLSEKVE